MKTKKLEILKFLDLTANLLKSNCNDSRNEQVDLSSEGKENQSSSPEEFGSAICNTITGPRASLIPRVILDQPREKRRHARKYQVRPVANVESWFRFFRRGTFVIITIDRWSSVVLPIRVRQEVGRSDQGPTAALFHSKTLHSGVIVS